MPKLGRIDRNDESSVWNVDCRRGSGRGDRLRLCESGLEKPGLSVEVGVVWLVEGTERELVDACDRPFDEDCPASESPLKPPGVKTSGWPNLADRGGCGSELRRGPRTNHSSRAGLEGLPRRSRERKSVN